MRGEQLGAPGARLAFPPGALLGRLLRLRELRDQRVARLLQLLDPGDVGLGPQRRRRQVARQVARVGGQLGLEPADLAPQLVANLDRLALARAGSGSARPLAGSPSTPGMLAQADRDDRQVARVEARLLGPPQRLGGDLLQLGRGLDPLGDEGALPLAADDQALALEALRRPPAPC